MPGNVVVVDQDVVHDVEGAVVDDVDVVADNVGSERRQVVGVVVAKGAEPVGVSDAGRPTLDGDVEVKRRGRRRFSTF